MQLSKLEETTTSLQEVTVGARESLGHATETCEICRGIWLCFLNPTEHRRISIGYTDDLVPPCCPGHLPLFNYCRDNSKADLPDGVEAIDPGDEENSRDAEDSGDTANSEAEKPTHADGANQMFVGTQVSSKTVLLTREIVRDSGVASQVIMLKNDLVPGHPGIGIRLDPDWIDLQLARKWKEKCLEEHGMKCNNPFRVSAVRPLWVVDVESRCIVPGRYCAAFVALSYRWGNHSWPRVNREMLNTIRKPGALDAANLAPIIRHAISLTSAIGERYLWVDALCIVQGHSAETANQLNLMGAFYASALVTIVVADGDSAAGIPGLKGVSNSRRAKQPLIPFGRETLVCPEFEIHLGEYKKRGWTYQEYIMSPRRLIFAGDRMQWVCQCCHWHEEMALGSEFDRDLLYNQPEPNAIFRGLPDFQLFGKLMSDYNSRSFSYEEDALPGISGLLSLFSRSFQGGFLCGLPEMFFDKALGWCASSDLRRRKPSGRSGKDQLDHSLGKLPSWSWVGWEGRISDGTLEPMEAIEAGNRGGWMRNIVEETTPITVWFTSHSADGTALRKIDPIWLEKRDARYKDLTRSLPEGWTRHEAKPPHHTCISSRRWHPPGCCNYVFQHRLFPERLWCKLNPDTAALFLLPMET